MAETEEPPTIPFKNLSNREYQGHKKKVHSVAWNCTGTKLASGSVDQTARVWHIEPHGHGKAKYIELKGHTDGVDQLCWDPKHADLIATASGDKTVRLWDARSKSLLFQVSVYMFLDDIIVELYYPPCKFRFLIFLEKVIKLLIAWSIVVLIDSVSIGGIHGLLVLQMFILTTFLNFFAIGFAEKCFELLL